MIDTVTKICTTQELSYMNIDSDRTIELLIALEYSLVKRNSLSVPFWSAKIGAEALNRILFILGKHNLVRTTVNKKYASFIATSKLTDLYGDVLDYRISSKIRRYGMKCNTSISATNLVKTPSGIKPTGLVRAGFAYASTQQFQLDIPMLTKYREAIILNTTKSIQKTMIDYSDIALDEANYALMCTEVIDNYIANPNNHYNLEYNISDQRGRSIYNGIKRIFNPISSKDSRALLVAPSIVISSDNITATRDIYLFIAELLGKKRTKASSKELAGRTAYLKKELPILDLATEHGRSELHSLLWLERLYSKLDILYTNKTVKWDIPLEVDAGMSLAQVIGATLNSEELLVKTNCVGTQLQDPWHIDGVRRIAGKTVGTPTFYGSSQSAVSLLKSKKLDPTKEELAAITKEFNNGTFSIIKDFKNLLIQNMDITTPTYEVQGWDETYTVEVNKFKTVGATLNAYVVWDTDSSKDKIFFLHSPIKVPDYSRFKLFGATGFVHNIESRIVDRTMLQLQEASEWAISIHDAILCMPGSIARKAYISQLEAFNAVGIPTLRSYMQSIGAVSAKSQIQLVKLLDKVTANHLPFSENALK